MLKDVHWYLDETKGRQFVFVLAELNVSDVGRCRAEMSRLPRKHHTAMHFNRETPETRAAALKAISRMPVRLTLIIVPREVKGLPARERAINALGGLATSHEPRRIVLERDESTEKHDRKWLRQELHQLPNIEYQHLNRSADSLLWIPDAIAWAYQRGGYDWAVVKDLIVDIVEA